MEREKVLDVIIKLMTLATDPGATLGEMEAAKHKAAHLMAKYNIEASETLKTKSQTEIKADIKEEQSKTVTDQSDWPGSLAHHISDCFDCKVMYTWGRRGIIFFGMKDDVEISKFLFAKIQIIIAIRAEKAFVKISDQEAYAIGAVWKIGERLHEMYVEAKKYMGNTCTDLIIVKKDAVVAYEKEKYPDLQAASLLDDSNKKNQHALRRGYVEATTIDISSNHKRVEGGTH